MSKRYVLCYALLWCVLREATPTVCGVYVVCFIKLASEGGAAARALDIAPPLSARCRGISRFSDIVSTRPRRAPAPRASPLRPGPRGPRPRRERSASLPCPKRQRHAQRSRRRCWCPALGICTQVSGHVLCRAAGQLRETRPKRALARVSALRTKLSCARCVHPPPCAPCPRRRQGFRRRI